LKNFILILALLLTTGCMATGTQVKEEQLAQFKKGKSTVQDVTDKLGAPNTVVTNSDGTKQACYSYMQAVARPESYIPFVGGLVGGADTKVNTVCLLFNDNGILKSYTSSASQMGTGMGFESGTTTTTNRVPSEPKQSE
jgi:outer membrane protein assembly factor BamE (lipoprotein component of BamABCDE complex)